MGKLCRRRGRNVKDINEHRRLFKSCLSSDMSVTFPSVDQSHSRAVLAVLLGVAVKVHLHWGANILHPQIRANVSHLLHM